MRYNMACATAIGMPLLMVIVGTISILTELRGALPQVGYVDQTGQLAAVEQVPIGDEVLQLVGYTDLDAARQALRRGDVAGYLVIPEGHFEGGASAAQLVVSSALLLLATAGTIWLMARLFRAQTLLSGESLSLGRPLRAEGAEPVLLGATTYHIVSIFEEIYNN